MPTLERLGKDDWAALFEAPLSVLIVGKSDCESCKRWAEELDAFLATDSEFPDLRLGKIDLDQPGLVSFKRAHPWVSELQGLPHTSIWRNGERVKEWLGGGVDRLTNRLRGVIAS